MRLRLLCVVLAAALGGCMVGPNYEKPVIETPNAYLYEPKEVAAEANIAWWQQYGDPVLDQLITDALAENKSVKIAAARVEQAAGVLTTQRAPLYPQVGYQGSAARERFSEDSGSLAGIQNPNNYYQALVGVSWELDLWGRIRRLTEAAQANLYATQEARRGVVLSLVSSVALNYIQLRSLDEQLDISQRTLATYAESLRLMELQFQYGRVSLMNVEQAKTRYQTAAAAIPQIRQQIVERENAISILLGRNPGPVPRGKSLSALALPEVPPGLPSALLEQRPDLLAAEQQLIAANAQIGAAKALYYPSISLTAALGGISTELGQLFSGPARAWNYGGAVTGPIFTAGSIEGQVAQAEASHKALLLAYQQAIQNAFADVENALNSRTELSKQLDAQEKLVKAQQNYARLAQLLYDGGYAPYSTVLQAEEQLFPSELNLATIRGQQLASLVNIYKAMGGGWVENATGMTEPAQVSESETQKNQN
jgi:outer membrane protein, multidrug efflux system